MAAVWGGGKFGLGHVESEMTESSRNIWEALAPGRVGRPRRDPEAVREEETSGRRRKGSDRDQTWSGRAETQNSPKRRDLLEKKNQR